MCIVIDTNTLSSVFNSSDSNYPEFSPVKDWIESGKGKLIYGGSTYLREISKTRYLSVFVEYNKQGKAVPLDSQTVDREERKAAGMVSHRNFDDPHIIAIVKVSNCCAVCTKDVRAIPYIKNKIDDIDFYGRPSCTPKIYSNKRHGEKLLVRVARQCSR